MASVTKEDAATYVVVYSRVFVRDSPSIDGKYVGSKSAHMSHSCYITCSYQQIKLLLLSGSASRTLDTCWQDFLGYVHK